MNITIEAIANGFVLTVATRQGVTKVFYPCDEYEKLQKEVSDVISEYEAQRREFLSKQNKAQD